MTTPERSRRNALDRLRQYPLELANKLPATREHLLELANKLPATREHLLELANKLPAIREHLLELANKVARKLADVKLAAIREHLVELANEAARKLADDRHAKREDHLRLANEGLKAYVPTEATPAMGTFVGLKPHEDMPGAADERLICDLIRWWMEHDPLGASRGVVDAVGLGGAHRLPADDRLKLARAFLAMLDIDPLAAQWSTVPAGPQEGLTQPGDDAIWEPGGGTAPLAAAVNKKSAARTADASPRVRRPAVC